MVLPNVSPIETEKSRHVKDYEKHVYFCKNCIHNIESHHNIKKCKFCGSGNIIMLKKSDYKLTKYKIAKHKLNDRLVSFTVKDHKSAKATEKIFNFLRRKINFSRDK